MNPSFEHGEMNEDLTCSLNEGLNHAESVTKLSFSQACESYDESDEDSNESVNDERIDKVTASIWATKAIASTREHQFSGCEQLRIPKEHLSLLKPSDLYRLIVTDEIIDSIVIGTNSSAERYLTSSNLVEHSKAQSWQPTDCDEIRKLLGIVICMELVLKPDIDLYWSKSVLYNHKYIPSIMERDRFLLLLKFLHFNVAENSSTSSFQQEIKPLLNILNKNYQALYTPGCDLILDKPENIFNMKFYKLCSIDSYTWNIQLHSGRNNTIAPLGNTGSLAVSLSEELLGCGRTVYCDRVYSSIPLAEYLLENKTYICGPLCKRQCPKVITDISLKKGEIASKQDTDGIKIIKWRDYKSIRMLSTVPEHSESLKGNERKNGIMKPEVVRDYYTVREKLEIADHIPSYHTALKKSKKKHSKVVLELLTGTSLVNAWVLYNKIKHRKNSIIEFKESLVYHLVKGPDPNSIDLNCIRNPVANGTTHKLQAANGPKRNTRKRCKGCYERLRKIGGSSRARNAKKVTTFCSECEDKPYLCLTCFNIKHQ